MCDALHTITVKRLSHRQGRDKDKTSRNTRAEFKDNLAPADIILLGPQVKYEQAKLQALADPFGKKVAVIDMMDYGMMKGDAVLDKALKMLE